MKGARYNRETLEVKFKGKSIADVLDMTVEVAQDFFKAVPSIREKMDALMRVGLGYIKVGQQATTLSGGEAQRVKLSKELSKRSTGRTLYNSGGGRDRQGGRSSGGSSSRRESTGGGRSMMKK